MSNVKKKKIASTPFSAITVVSPSRINGERKNQDRARWFESYQSAGLADGVSLSPYSAEAATIATNFTPVLFNNHLPFRLGIAADLLMAQRDAIPLSRLKVRHDLPADMRQLLEEVVRDKMKQSHQTTLLRSRLGQRRTVWWLTLLTAETRRFWHSVRRDSFYILRLPVAWIPVTTRS